MYEILKNNFKVLVFMLISGIFTNCNPVSVKQNAQIDNTRTALYIMHAGSLSVPFKEIAKAFMEKHPNITIKLESGGSVANARKVTELGQYCDIFASADYQVIDKMLIPEFASYNIKFASNEMVIAFNQTKKKHNINAQNWFDVLMLNEVEYGRSDPNADPCGYRSEMLIQLAAEYYKNKKLLKLLDKDINNIRPKEVDLLALIQSNNIDYIFIYKSVAMQHQLDYITLPDSINLGKPALNDWYATSKVKISGQKPGTFITQTGEAMLYSVTILNQTKNKEAANLFLAFLLRKNGGRKIMKNNGQNDTIMVKGSEIEYLPINIKKLLKN